MPYKLRSQAGKTCVINSATGNVVPGGCHPSRVKAMAHMRALYANVPDARVASANEEVEVTEVAPNVNVSFPDANWTGHVTISPGNTLPEGYGNAGSGVAIGTKPVPPPPEALVAAAVAPIAPPKEWFDSEEPDHPEPLTVEEDGRVHGHLALWDACHVGILNGQMAECVKPPRSSTDYGNFHLGQMVTEDGSPVSVGKLVYDGSHAALTADLVGATQHYDKTGRVGAFVRARDGRHGIYLSGATRSDLSPEGLRDLRANPPSGDWRNLRGKLEMIAALSVPVPGFQTPQLALTASGSIEALILPGWCPECQEEMEEDMLELSDKAYIRARSQISDSLTRESLTAAALTTKRRNALRTSVFAVPEERKFPIPDRSHAANALARASGTKYEARVRRAVCRRYPTMGECAENE